MVNEPFILRMLANSDENVSNNIVNIATSVLVVPFVEELMFRGLIFNKWAQKMGILKAVILSSLVFSILHTGTFYLPQLLCGLFLCFVYLKTRKLYVSMIFHGVFNGLLSLFVSLDFGSNPSADPATPAEQLSLIKIIGIPSLILFVILLPLTIWAFYKLYNSSEKIIPYQEVVQEDLSNQTISL